MKLYTLKQKNDQDVFYRTSWKSSFFREKYVNLLWVLLILNAGPELWYVFPMLLYHHFHFSCRMSPALGWIPALNATFGKPSWRKFRMAVQLCWHPTGRTVMPAANIFLFSVLTCCQLKAEEHILKVCSPWCEIRNMSW